MNSILSRCNKYSKVKNVSKITGTLFVCHEPVSKTIVVCPLLLSAVARNIWNGVRIRHAADQLLGTDDPELSAQVLHQSGTKCSLFRSICSTVQSGHSYVAAHLFSCTDGARPASTVLITAPIRSNNRYPPCGLFNQATRLASYNISQYCMLQYCDTQC